ncbi:MAG: hypothetical protein ACI9R3_002369 [Verrucomicrobiales bacterium]|jgi:hypothetical protein
MLNVSLDPNSNRFCNGQSRRDFLRVGALAPFGLSLPGFLRAETVHAPKGARARSVILVFLGGGLSHHDSFDPKPDAPEEIRGKYKPISTNVPGLHVGELLPRMAKTMDKVCLVRSGTHENDHHETATNWVLSGRFGSAFGDYPSMGAVVANRTGFTGVLPPYVAVPRNPSFTWELGKSAFLGGRCESFKAGDPSGKDYRVRDLAAARGSAKALEKKRSLLQSLDTLSREIQGNDQLATYDEFQGRAADMVLSTEAQDAFAIDAEPEARRDRFGHSTFGQSCLLARRLVERGVRFCTVNYAGWDHHAKIFDSLDKKLPEFDQGFSALIEDMSASGLLDETLVVAMGEFGRSPKINKEAGRDHWGRAGSMIFAGAGVQGGKIVGGTDKEGGMATSDPVRPADVAYTVYESLGIDPRSEIHTPDGRPMAILDEGNVIHQLYA